MYLSYLLIDTGGNPDRPRPGRSWLNNIYNVHRRISMAFPSANAKENDPHNIQPFNKQIVKERDFLFRIDHNVNEDGKRAIIIVQSNIEPDWDYCFHNARDFLLAPPETKLYAPDFAEGSSARFRILMNLSVKSSKYRVSDFEGGETGRQGKRIAFTWDSETSPEDAVSEWFRDKTKNSGFTIDEIELKRLNWVYGSKMNLKADPADNPKFHKMKYRAALLDGILTVADKKSFENSIGTGIGSAKSMGFGLLSAIQIRD